MKKYFIVTIFMAILVGAWTTGCDPVKACLNDNNLESCKKACDKDDTSSCHKACESGDHDACKKACDKGDKDSCGILKTACRSGKVDACEAVCRNGSTVLDGMACIVAGDAVMSANDLNVSSVKKAHELYKKSCDLNYFKGCGKAVDLYNLSLKDQAEYNALRDETIRSWINGCKLNDGQGCLFLILIPSEVESDLLDEYRLTESNNNKMKFMKTAKRGCDLKDANACFLIGGLTEDNKKMALTFFRTACNLNHPDGCKKTAGLIASLAEEPDKLSNNELDKVLEETNKFQKTACDLNSLEACLTLAVTNLDVPYAEKSLDIAKEMCDYDKSTCDNIEPVELLIKKLK